MDFKLVENNTLFDFNIEDGGKVTSDSDIRTAVMVSIFTDRRYEEGDLIENNKKGWWGDTYHDSRIGSRLWTLRRRKATPQVLRLANDIVRQSLQWLIDDGVAKEVNVQNFWSKYHIGTMLMLIDIKKPNGDDINFKFEDKWSIE